MLFTSSLARRWALFSFPFFLAVAPLTAQGPGALSGEVTDSARKKLNGITVRVDPAGKTAETDGNGKFSILGLAAGSYLVTATGRGFVPWQETVLVRESGAAIEVRMSTVQTAVEVHEVVDDILATSSVSVTKSPENLINLPYAVQVIPRALLESRQIQDVKDLYRNISGVSDSPYSAMTFRGFTQREILFNGVRGNPYGSLDNDVNDAGFSTSQGRLSNIEFVEVIKGNAAVLFGAGEPGGIMNFVTNKPRQTPMADLGFRVGSFRQLGGHGQVSGPVAKARNLFYRAAWYQEDRKTFRHNSRNENYHLNGALSWRLGEATSLGFEYEYIDQLLPGHRLRGIPVNAAGRNLTYREWSAGEPTDFSALQARVWQTRFDHAFTPTLRTDATFRYLNYDRPERYHEPRGLNADGRTMRREFRNQYRANDDWSLTANGYERWSPEKFGRHSLAFGVEVVNQDWLGRFGTIRDQGRGGPVLGIDLLAPVYGLSRESMYARPAFSAQTVEARRTGLFVQDQIEVLPGLQISLGGRVEGFRDRGRDTGPLAYDATRATGRIGAVYRIQPRWSVFGSFSNAFTRAPILAQTPAGNGPHDPETSRQVEGGVKAELSQGRVLLTGTLFQIRKNNVFRLDPNFGPRGDNFAAVLPIGRVRNQGLELDMTGRLTSNLSVIVNYSFLDSEILADRIAPNTVGGPMPNAPRHAFGLFGRYEITRTGTTFSVGQESRGRRFEPYAGIQAAGYGLWDFGLFQRVHKLVELRVQLENAFDREYATASLFAARAGNWPGAPRTFTVGLRFARLNR